MTPLTLPARPWSARRWMATSAVLLIAALGGCGGDDDASRPAAEDQTTQPPPDDYSPDAGTGNEGEPAASAAITASGFAFATGVVTAGEEVSFANDDSAPHTATADDGSFDTGRVEAGESATFTAPDEPGDHAFHCEVHPDMQATLTVE